MFLPDARYAVEGIDSGVVRLRQLATGRVISARVEVDANDGALRIVWPTTEADQPSEQDPAVGPQGSP